jgi:hypothetical protein
MAEPLTAGRTIAGSRCCMCKSILWLVWRGGEILPTCLQCERDRPEPIPGRPLRRPGGKPLPAPRKD